MGRTACKRPQCLYKGAFYLYLIEVTNRTAMAGGLDCASFRLQYGPGVDSASNRNEYQEYLLGVKAAGAYGWQPYHLHVPIVLKSGSPNLLEPSGLVQACNGIALPYLPSSTSDFNTLHLCICCHNMELTFSNGSYSGMLPPFQRLQTVIFKKKRLFRLISQ